MSSSDKIEKLNFTLTKRTPGLIGKINTRIINNNGNSFIRLLIVGEDDFYTFEGIGYDIYYQDYPEKIKYHRISIYYRKGLLENPEMEIDMLDTSTFYGSITELEKEIRSCYGSMISKEQLDLLEKERFDLNILEKPLRFEKLKSLYEKLTLLFSKAEIKLSPVEPMKPFSEYRDFIEYGYALQEVSTIKIKFPEDSMTLYETNVSELTISLLEDKNYSFSNERSTANFNKITVEELREKTFLYDYSFNVKKDFFYLKIEKQILEQWKSIH